MTAVAVGVLASGGGSNLQSIIDAAEEGWLGARVAVVISDLETAGALERARRHGIPTMRVRVPPTGTQGWEQANEAIAQILKDHGVQLVAMAGYMRKVSPGLLKAFPGAVMNIHPALLPAFQGTRGQRDAVKHGVKLAGATVHFADEEFDRGPIIIQGAVPVINGETPETLAARILKVEHQIYPRAIQWFCQGRLRVRGRCVTLQGAPGDSDGSLVWPPLDA